MGSASLITSDGEQVEMSTRPTKQGATNERSRSSLHAYSSFELMTGNVKLKGCMTRKMGQAIESNARNREAKVIPLHEASGRKHARQLLETEKLLPRQWMAHTSPFVFPTI